VRICLLAVLLTSLVDTVFTHLPRLEHLVFRAFLLLLIFCLWVVADQGATVMVGIGAAEVVPVVIPITQVSDFLPIKQ